jgi:hypothetical protein
MLICEECALTADEHPQGWRGGWRAYLAYGAEDVFPYTVVFCPKCAEREFGPLPYPEPRAS